MAGPPDVVACERVCVCDLGSVCFMLSGEVLGVCGAVWRDNRMFVITPGQTQ